jgi:hypothetical protein
MGLSIWLGTTPSITMGRAIKYNYKEKALKMLMVIGCGSITKILLEYNGTIPEKFGLSSHKSFWDI